MLTQLQTQTEAAQSSGHSSNFATSSFITDSGQGRPGFPGDNSWRLLLQHEKHPLRIKHIARQDSLAIVIAGRIRELYLQRLKLFETSKLVLVDIQKRVGRQVPFLSLEEGRISMAVNMILEG